MLLLVTALLVESVPDILSGLLFLADVDWTRNCGKYVMPTSRTDIMMNDIKVFLLNSSFSITC